MGKERTTVSVDEQLLREIRTRDELNLSGVVNDFLRGYLAHGSATSAALEARLGRLRDQRERLVEEIEDVENEIAYVEEMLETQQRHGDEDLERIARLAEDLPPQLDQDNPAIQNWAAKLDRRPAELVDVVEEYRQNGHASA